MGRGTWSWVVPDGLWEIARPLIPPSRVRPQGGGTQDTPDETLFAAIIYVLVSGCAWRQLPPCFGVSKSTAHRRFLIWSRAGVWGRLHEAVLHRLDDAGLIDVTRVVLDTAHVRAKKGGEHTGPSPVDRGKPGSKMHVLSDANGLPLLVGVSAGNTHDSEGLKPMVEGHQTRHDPHRGRYFKPQRLHADKAYDRADLRRWLRWKRIGVRIARKGIESSERLGRRRWVIERTMSWLSGYRRLSPRYERNPRNYLAFLGLAAAICCYKRLVRLTT
ncbi:MULTISPECIES: IS5 family transposase [Streptomyces]|uniref:IS5 family transposase n=1 Tax=Streptomyces TaxID=1883 RepID=UPI000F7A6C3B|nr:IS5 family transposase [Streptomyces sp. WAC05858]WTA78604.1 IS5 family transposase [Streptomyces antimycoticus]RSS26481.1 IS5 family transposase [Streptomyces sp. WAC05858]WTA78605.1 IS5 family transposase [Streptomyces antimycoticus]WTA80372.1 IS5 family transposase [Streptomyces antimycoticus]WTA80373.1 IS5 family transposase [Streptomyces antimycoticus]